MTIIELLRDLKCCLGLSLESNRSTHSGAYTVPAGYRYLSVSFIDAGTIDGVSYVAGSVSEDPAILAGTYGDDKQIDGTNYTVTEVR